MERKGKNYKRKKVWNGRINQEKVCQNGNCQKDFYKKPNQELKFKITLENSIKHGMQNSKIMERKRKNWDKKVRKNRENNKN